MTPQPTPEQPTPKQVPLPKPLARAISTNLANLNALAAEVQAARLRFELANNVNLEIVRALILSAGFELKDFINYVLWEDPATGEIFLRPNNGQPSVMPQEPWSDPDQRGDCDLR